MTSVDEGCAVARGGDAQSLGNWLDAGGNPDQYDSGGWTPLLWAAVRGHSDLCRLLLERGANPSLPHRESGALPIHFAGQSGSVPTAELLLKKEPGHINVVWDIHGHSILLQAVFYGHIELTRYLLTLSPDMSITTARGLGAMDLATQFQNREMMDLLRPHDVPAEEKAGYYRSFLQRIAPVVPPGEEQLQALADRLVHTIEDGIKRAASDSSAVKATLDAVREIVEGGKLSVNRLGGPLQQPPLIVVVTGNNGFPPNPDVARLRNELARYLLDHGADPTLHEKHPMGAQTIIRAAVFNHLDILKMCENYVSARQLTDAINEIPQVNALTAMHDTVLRATMAAPDRFEGYLDQARWFVAHGGRSDIEEYSGVTQRNIAERAKDPEVRRRLIAVLDGRG